MRYGFLRQKKLIFILIVLIILAGIGVYYFLQYQKTQELLKDPTKATVAENQALIDRVGKLILLPGEEPRIATVSDKTQLSGQSFFNKAENGDKVLIYTNAKKAILYRPSLNKIIEVSSVNFETNTQPQISPIEVQNSSPSVSPTVKLTPTVTPQITITPTP
jgi:hypothetical protein